MLMITVMAGDDGVSGVAEDGCEWWLCDSIDGDDDYGNDGSCEDGDGCDDGNGEDNTGSDW